MSKRCPDCHRINEDSRIFCAYCGSTLDAQLRLIQDLEKQTERPKEPAPKQRGDVNFYTSRSAPKKEKSGVAPWVVFGLLAIAAVIVWLVLK